jgi:hypothetical protein
MTLGIYIQVPFCQTKCTYCNFHTGVVSRDRYQPYADAICREIGGGVVAAAFRPAISSAGHGLSRAESGSIPEGASIPAARELLADTIYFGGGTPSLLDPAALAKILDALRSTYSLETPEITLEADPETITPEKANSWRASGFNRTSLGVQSFNDREPPAVCTAALISPVPLKSSAQQDSKTSAWISSSASRIRPANRGNNPSVSFSICAPSTSRSTCWKWTKAAI